MINIFLYNLTMIWNDGQKNVNKLYSCSKAKTHDLAVLIRIRVVLTTIIQCEPFESERERIDFCVITLQLADLNRVLNNWNCCFVSVFLTILRGLLNKKRIQFDSIRFCWFIEFLILRKILITSTIRIYMWGSFVRSLNY